MVELVDAAFRTLMLHPPAAHPSPVSRMPATLAPCPRATLAPGPPQVYRLMQLQQSVDIFLSHDWPTGIARYGNMQQLLARKVGRSNVAGKSAQSP